MDNEGWSTFSHAEPVLAVQDVAATISYWQEVLCFPNSWTAGEPARHGAVSRDGAFVQFTLNPELAASSKGNSIWIRVQRIDILYAQHRARGAEVVSPLENMPYGFAEYTVREINGYYISFAAPVSDREKGEGNMPDSIRIIPRTPAADEYQNLKKSVGWGVSDNVEKVGLQLAAATFGVVAEHRQTGDIVGCALLTSDGLEFYHVRDVIVRPDWQGKRIGTGLMQVLSGWIDTNLPDSSLVALITGENVEPFYRQFGFEKAFSMIKMRRLNTGAIL
jgi:GNAT superfamily N-acetyltransferase/uncharacterized glyoxalase superfamily protein PhnB